MAKNERLNNVLSGIKFKYKIKTQAEIASKLGTSPTYLSDILSGKYPISEKISDALCEKFGVNAEYLEGKSDMIWLIVPEKSNPVKNFEKGVPYYNIDFVGGFDLVINEQTINPEYLIDFKLYNKATCWCNITGHSMEPEIASGDIIALKEVHDPSFLPFGEIYAIITTNGLRTVKRIGPASKPGYYALIPTNKAPEYGIQEIPKNMIYKVYEVLGCMKKL